MLHYHQSTEPFATTVQGDASIAAKRSRKTTSGALIATLAEDGTPQGRPRLKLLRLTPSYVKRHITRAREKFEITGSMGGYSFHKGISYQRLIADLDSDNPKGTYCYHCRNIAAIDDMVVSHARCSLARVYHEECGRLINVWP